MKNKLTSLIIGTALLGTLALGTETSAAEIEIQKGDTLWNIAQENQMTVNELKEINKLSSNVIQPTQILETSNKKKEDVKSESTYKVKSGDSLSKIGVDFGVKVNELKDWNDLNSDLIIVNQELLIKGGEKQASTEQAEPVEQTEAKPSNKTETKPKKQEKPVEQAEPAQKSEEKSQSGQSMTMEATAYTAECYGCSGVTATGIDLNADRNKKLIAVDPSVIPLGSRVHVEGYGEAIAGDTGGAIKGNRIDLHMPTKGEANDFGRRTVNITVLD